MVEAQARRGHGRDVGALAPKEMRTASPSSPQDVARATSTASEPACGSGETCGLHAKSSSCVVLGGEPSARDVSEDQEEEDEEDDEVEQAEPCRLTLGAVGLQGPESAAAEERCTAKAASKTVLPWASTRARHANARAAQSGGMSTRWYELAIEASHSSTSRSGSTVQPSTATLTTSSLTSTPSLPNLVRLRGESRGVREQQGRRVSAAGIWRGSSPFVRQTRAAPRPAA